jgi:hypothetical protein
VLAVSGPFDGVEEPELVRLVLLGVAGDLVSTSSRTWREGSWLLPSLVAGLFLAGAGALALAMGAAPVLGALVLATGVVSLPVLWVVKRRGRRDDRIQRIWQT